MLHAPASQRAGLHKQTLQAQTAQRLRVAAKRMGDCLIGSLALLALAPLFLLIAVLIKLESPGPVLHRRLVLGLHGRRFYAYKFRTVYTDGSDRLVRNRQQWVALLRNDPTMRDPRLTRVGFYLRQYGLDLLPRLFNVLAGNMSLVGPHLLSPREVMQFGQNRLGVITSVRPGLTGAWQIKARQSAPQDRLRLELEYIHNWSLQRDLQILLGTFAAVREEQVL